MTKLGKTEKFQDGGKPSKTVKPSEIITVGDKEYNVEIADTEEARVDGLSRVKKLASDEGMLFVHDEVTSGYYTMKDTSIDLDIIFIDKDGTVIKVVTAAAHSQDPIECDNYLYVLEVNANSGIEEGDELNFEDNSFTEEEE